VGDVKRFEDLDAWKVSRELTRVIYTLTRADVMRRDFGFIDQVRRAAVSIMNNIAEGFERGSNKDFVKFLFIARGSAGEVRSMLYVARDQDYLSETEFSESYNLCVRTSQVCWGLIKHLQKNSGWRTGAVISLLMIIGVLFPRVIARL